MKKPQNKQNYKLILFDADGTLFDFRKTEKLAFEKTLNDFGINQELARLHSVYEEINKAHWLAFQKKQISSVKLRTERFRQFFLQEDLELSAQEVSPRYLHNLSQGTDLLPGAEEVVKHFAGKCEIALATNGLADVQKPRFAASSLAQYFRHIFISEEIGHPKPETSYFDHIFELLPYREQSLIVGDNFSSDIIGGINAGIDTCWYNPDARENGYDLQPDYEIKDLLELKDLIYI